MTTSSKHFVAYFLTALCLILSFSTDSYAGSVTLFWDEVTENTDNSQLTDLSGYVIYYDTVSRNAGDSYTYSDNITVNSLSDPANPTSVVNNISSGTWYFRVAAYNSIGNESIKSDEISITVNSAPAPEIVVSDSVSPISDLQVPFGNVTEGSLSNETVTVTNNGNADLVIGSIAQSNPLASPFSILNDNCSGQTLSPSSNCTLTVRFAPSGTGSYNDSFNIPSNDADENSVTVSVNGSGEAIPLPDITVTDSVAPAANLQIPFGNVTEGSLSNETVTVTNNGNADLVIGSIAQSNPLASPFSILNDNCSGQTLSPSSNCTLTVRFAPSGTGSYNDSFNIPSNDPNEDPVTISVSGTGEVIPLPDVSVSDSVAPGDDLQVPFGGVTEGTTSEKTITVTNNGNADLVIGNIAQGNALSAPFSILNDNCSGQTLSPSSNCTFKVRFTPSTTGSYNNAFDIPSNDPDESSVTVSVSGSGEAIPLPDITVTDSVAPAGNLQIPFGNVTEGSLSNETVTVTNNGNADLVIGSIAQSNPLASPFSILNDNCSGQTVLPSSNCILTVRFSPATSGQFSDSFNIPSNDADEDPVTISVSGTGEVMPLPDVSVSDSVAPGNDLQVPFGDVTEGLSTDHTVTIQNNGSANLETGTIASNNPLSTPFSILNNTCSGQTITPSSNCTLTIRFAPSTTGSYNDSFDIPSNDPDENPVTVSISGTGLSSIVNNPPEDPVLVYPADGQRSLGETVGFIWEQSTDPDGDTVTYDLYVCDDRNMSIGCITELNIAFLWNESIYYAGIVSFGSSSLLFAIISVLTGITRYRKKKVFLILTTILITGILLVACGGGGSGNGAAGATISSIPSNDINYTVSGLNTGRTYYWKVVAKDGNGGEASSEVRSFETL